MKLYTVDKQRVYVIEYRLNHILLWIVLNNIMPQWSWWFGL